MKKSEKTNDELFRYHELLMEKVDAQTDAFIKRIKAMKYGKLEEAYHIEQMVLEPINLQIRYLTKKIKTFLST